MLGFCPMVDSDASAITNRYPPATGVFLAIGSAFGIGRAARVDALADAYGFTGGMSVILLGIAALLPLAALNVARGRYLVYPCEPGKTVSGETEGEPWIPK